MSKGSFLFIKSYRKLAIVCFAFLTVIGSYTKAAEVEAIPQAVLDLQQAAEQCITAENNTGALENYQSIVQAFPDTPYALDARKNIVKLYLQSGNATAADTELVQLLEKYGDTENLFTPLSEIRVTSWLTGHYAEHQSVCQEILNRCSDTLESFNTLGNLICGAVHIEDTSAAEAGIELLFSQKYTEPEDAFLSTVIRVQDTFRLKNNYPMVIAVGDRALATNPTHKNAAWVYQQLVISYSNLNAPEQMEAAINTILEKYSGHPVCAKVVNSIADEFHKNRQYAKALELYQTALNQAGSNEAEQLRAYAGMAKAAVWTEETATDPNSPALDTPNVDAIVQLLMTDFRDAQTLGFHVFLIAQEYYRVAGEVPADDRELDLKNYQKAIEIWEKNINEIDDTRYFSEGCYFSGVSYRYMGEYELAIARFEELLDKTPDFDRAWNAQHLIANCLDQMYIVNELSYSEAKTRIMEVCQKINEQYPDTPAVRMADFLLEKYKK